MRALFVLIVLLFSFAAHADARVEVGPNGYDNKGESMIHFPYDSAETDNEYYSSTGEITFMQYDGGNRGHVRATHSMVLPEIMLPPGLQYMPKMTVDDESTGETCTVEANGTTFVSDAWLVELAKYGDVPGMLRVEMVISCYNAVAQ